MTTPTNPTKQRARSPWLLGFRALAHPRLRLVCFPHAGGSASAYRSWATAFPADVEVLGVQLPGRGARFKEPLATRLAPLIDALTPEIVTLGTQAPFALFGHSMGALLAFELSRALRERGARMPTHMVVSAYHAPGLPERFLPIHRLPDREFLTELRHYGGMPSSVLEQPELTEVILPIIRADFELVETWAHLPDTPLDVPITAIGGDVDANATPDEMAGWREHTRGEFARHTLHGDHFFLQSAEPALLEILLKALT